MNAGGKLSVNMTQPSTNISINESGSNYYFNQTCELTCKTDLTICEDVYLYPQYYNGTWNDILASNTGLLVNQPSYSCGNVSKTSAEWWNTSWKDRKRISLDGHALVNYSISFTLNTTGPGFLDNGDDVRIIYWNGTDNAEIDRFSSNGWNSGASKIWFKIQKAAVNSSDYYVYYNNSLAGTPMDNASNIFVFYEDFESYGSTPDGVIPPTWTDYGSGGDRKSVV